MMSSFNNSPKNEYLISLALLHGFAQSIIELFLISCEKTRMLFRFCYAGHLIRISTHWYKLQLHNEIIPIQSSTYVVQWRRSNRSWEL